VAILPDHFGLPLGLFGGVGPQVHLDVGRGLLSVGEQRQLPHVVHHHPEDALRELEGQFELALEPARLILRVGFSVWKDGAGVMRGLQRGLAYLCSFWSLLRCCTGRARADGRRCRPGRSGRSRRRI
jgi:hypothetical protein